MGTLTVEFRARGEWHPVVGPALTPGAPPGSMSHNGPAGRQVYLFGCDGDYSLVLRSRGGVDVEHAGLVRELTALEGFEEVARLTPERPSFECWLKTDRMREPTRVRFRHNSDEEL